MSENVHREEETDRPIMWTVRVLICLAHHSVCIREKKQTCSIEDSGGKRRWLQPPYNEVQAQRFQAGGRVEEKQRSLEAVSTLS